MLQVLHIIFKVRRSLKNSWYMITPTQMKVLSINFTCTCIYYLQVDVEPCLVVFPTQHLVFTTPDVTIPHCLHDLVTLGQSSDCPPVLVMCVPSLSIHSSGHKPVDPAQDIPLSRMDLPQEPGGSSGSGGNISKSTQTQLP